MRAFLLRTLGAIGAAALTAASAAAQQPGTPAATVIAIPPMTTPDSGTRGNQMLALAWQATQLIGTLGGIAELAKEAVGGSTSPAKPRAVASVPKAAE